MKNRVLPFIFLLSLNISFFTNGQNATTLDTINIVGYRPISRIFTDTLEYDTLDFKVYSVTPSDTLILKAFVACNGEFGGHYEFLYIYKIDDNWCVKWKNYHMSSSPSSFSSCQPVMFSKGVAGFICKEMTIQINDAGLNKIQNYLESFEIFIKKFDCISNAKSNYWVYFRGKSWYRNDWCGHWRDFFELRDGFFKQFEGN
jgi:hypothetical protein